MADIFKLFNDAVFGPEELEVMGNVFDLAKAELPTVDPYEIAASIVRHATNRMVDGPTLATLVLDELGPAQGN